MFVDKDSIHYDEYYFEEDEENIKLTIKEAADNPRYSEMVRESYITEYVFLTREEAEEFGKNNEYNYREGWRVFGVPSKGSLVNLIKNS